jgi:exo-beta-1,3-glucanase (GH17 family)
MSFRKERFQQVDTANLVTQISYTDNYSADELHDLFLEILHSGVHGFCFSLYEEGQKPGDVIGADQIRKRLNILKPVSQWVRSFSCIEGNELVPVIAKELGMSTLVGAWLGDDKEKNEQEIQSLISLANTGMVDVAVVGNEVLYRKELTEEELIETINYVRSQIPSHIPVGYVDAYYEFVRKPELVEACDVILCNCYPYWEGTSFQDSFGHMTHMFNLAKNAGHGKRVIITETGWPSNGESLGGAIPSHLNSLKYFLNTQLWAKDNGIEVFYFSSFDESWKKSAEGEVGAYWGIWDSNGNLKF